MAGLPALALLPDGHVTTLAVRGGFRYCRLGESSGRFNKAIMPLVMSLIKELVTNGSLFPGKRRVLASTEGAHLSPRMAATESPCTWQRVQGPLGKRCHVPPLGLSLLCGWDKQPCPFNHVGLRADRSFWLLKVKIVQLAAVTNIYKAVSYFITTVLFSAEGEAFCLATYPKG